MTRIDPNFSHDEQCACLRPGDAMCNCHVIAGYATRDDMEEADAALEARYRMEPQA